ncbi:ABC transporter substrate-binding protein [Pseudobacillus sp. FSL P4-0506]|uniref:ABC transporter substrate-binding protein n=1 Tax=unclassified Pseudobacillus TaxID=2619284 RepID=UPI0030FB03B8
MIKKNIWILTGVICIAALWVFASFNHESSSSASKTAEKITDEWGTAAAPKRAVALNQHATEIMLALGLEDSMVGTAYLDDRILPELEEAYRKVPVLAAQYPSKEVFFAAEPDFAYAGWKSAFTEKTLGTPEELEAAGIPVYVQQSSSKTSPTLEDVYTDIKNIGKIFHIEKRAENLVSSMKKEIDETVQQIGTVSLPLKVFVYDSGEDKPLTAANTYLTKLIEKAGAKNIFQDVNKGWTSVSWEAVIERNPDVIVIMDYGDQTAEQKKKFLLSKKELADVEAIENNRIITMPLSAGAEGIRAPLALKTLAEGLYPEKFSK